MDPHSTDAIRAAFLSFFEARDHVVVPSSPLVPANDPTLLFTNAGMVQFKDVFTGKETRAFARATSSQKCVRAGGKHNDLENVGYTPRHHTFFEMLGNFSFGDYFKEDAIRYAWSFITETLGLLPDRLAVTVFEGDEEIPGDDEAAEIWTSVGVRPERIYRLGRKDNYWQMGDTGPQGPCSEIHYCLKPGPDMWDLHRVAESVGWLEIWNLVFMQFERSSTDSPLEPLPKPCVDTGAGLERLAMVMQGQTSTYDIDLFRSLLGEVARIARRSYGTHADDDVSMRVIADHARATSFLVADGIQPSNEGRGYVLRRIMRRAIRHGNRLGLEDLFFHEACTHVIRLMQGSYPELGRAEALIEKVAKNEESSFRRTLEKGLGLLEDQMARLPPGSELAASFVADLYDTFGFPIDLTRVIAEEQGRKVDEQRAHEEVRLKQSKGGGTVLSQDKTVATHWFTLRDQLGPTVFEGYKKTSGKAKIVALVRGDQTVDKAEEGDEVDVLLDRTPFYGESGGQVGDRGELSAKGLKVSISNTLKPLPELAVHRGRIVRGSLSVHDGVTASIDVDHRTDVMRNHSATHLLHLALREVLGEHVQQKGSLVASDRLRFDFSHFDPVTQDELRRIERRVSDLILRNAPTQVAEASIEEAKSAGAMMLFGEKYGDRVRTVRIGRDSFELCGGTHVKRSGDIGLFKIVSESAVASGVRRIEAVTGEGAVEWVLERERLLAQSAGALKATPEDLPSRIEKLVRRNKELERELEQTRAQAAVGSSSQPDEIEELNGVRVLFKRADGTPKKALRSLADRLRDKLQSGVVVLSSQEADRVSLLVAATKDVSARIDAGRLIKAAMGPMEGSGGGRADFAQGGGRADQLDAGLMEIRRELAS
ncbi:MAG: alanine--tRNA ligase [Myxococcota bacterium]